jgi:hypothetical protein
MSLAFSPGVRVVLGYAATARRPPERYTSDATLALQRAVASLGRDWKRHAPGFAVFPAAGSGRVVIGVASSRAPVTLDAPRALGPSEAISREHFVAHSGLGSAAEVDRRGETLTTDGILRALDAARDQPAIAEMGLRLDDREGEARSFLLSDDGRWGALVYGQALWRRGDLYEGGEVRTWSREYDDGEGVRLVGVARAEVHANAPLVALESDDDPRCYEFERRTADAVRAVLETRAPRGWFLVTDPAATPAGRAASQQA